MADAGSFVYGCSRDAHAQITQLSDFISPTIVAMWNLRWQVQGFVAAFPEAKQADIVQRFALGSKTKGNELKRACIDNSWEEQKRRFSSVLLINTISVFARSVSPATSSERLIRLCNTLGAGAVETTIMRTPLWGLLSLSWLECSRHHLAKVGGIPDHNSSLFYYAIEFSKK
jgi:hypothetical protein